MQGAFYFRVRNGGHGLKTHRYPALAEQPPRRGRAQGVAASERRAARAAAELEKAREQRPREVELRAVERGERSGERRKPLASRSPANTVKHTTKPQTAPI